MKSLGLFVFSVAVLGSGFTEPALAIAGGQDFESYAVGATKPYLHDEDHDFGWFTGGTVEQPGASIDASFTLGDNRVYYGSELSYTNILPGPYHCCGYGRMEMRVTAPNGVTIEYYGHILPFDPDLGYFPEELMYSETVYGVAMLRGWGVPFILGQEPPANGNSDITTLRWISLDGSAIAIDNVVGIGDGVIPEPAAWAMMIAGFGMVGASFRQRRRVLA